MYTLDENAIKALANNPKIIEHFPELKAIKDVPRSCCGRSPKYNPLQKARQFLTSLSEPNAKILKQLLNVESLRVRTINNGKVKEIVY